MKTVLAFTAEDVDAAAAAIFQVRHPGWVYSPSDTWARQHAEAALRAIGAVAA